MENTGFIFDTKKFAINDGPGIRTTIFFKGCSLNCQWCHNPESISAKPQKMFNINKCITCGECVTACQSDAISLATGKIVFDNELCNLSGACAEACPTGAIEMVGRTATVAELMEIIEKDRIFYDQSEGGVTFSGGEVLLQPNFLIELLDTCKKEHIHRTLDTTGNVASDILLEVAKRVDLFLYDLKMIDCEKHQKYCGVSNTLILDNLKKLSKQGAHIIIRIPFINGVNSDDVNIEATAKFVAALEGEKKLVNLLPFHKVAEKKSERLGKHCDLSKMAEPTPEELSHAVSIFAKHGVTAKIGG